MSKPLFTALLLLSPTTAIAAPAIALSTANELLFFDTAAPAAITRTVPLIGMSGGETMLAIDHRPITGVLYGASSASQIYTIDPATGMVMPLRNSFLPLLASTEVGFDFDPLSDRIRVSSTGGPLVEIITLSGSAASSTQLVYRFNDPNAAFTPSIAALAHDRNFLGTTATTLFGIDDQRDTLVTIDPATGMAGTVGSIGADATQGLAFDISGNVGWAVIGSSVHRVDLASGAATEIAAFPGPVRGITLLPPGSLNFAQPNYEIAEDSGAFTVTVRRSGGASGAVSIAYTTRDGSARAGSDYENASGTIDFAGGQTSADIELRLIADAGMEPNETFTIQLSAPMGGADIGGLGVTTVTVINDENLGFFAVNEAEQLIELDDANLGQPTRTTTITGLAANETLLGIDFAADGTLYALGATRRLYRIDTTSGAATAINAMPFAPALRGGAFGFEIEPLGARITTDRDQSLLLDLTTATAAQVLPNLFYAPGDPNYEADPAITAIAAAENNTLGIDQTLDVLVTADTPGALRTIGPLGVNAGFIGGFDVFPGAPLGYAVINVGFSNPTLFAIDLMTGRATSIASINTVAQIRGLAIAPSGRFEFAATVYTVREGESVTVTLERSGGDNGTAAIAIELSGGTATAGTDYTFMRGEVLFAHRQRTATIDIPISADAEVEGIETAILRIDDPRAGARSSATLSITDGDPPPPDAGTIDGGNGDAGQVDGNTNNDDASVTNDAALPAADAGTGNTPEENGCGCRAASSRSNFAPLLLLLACCLLRRKT